MSQVKPSRELLDKLKGMTPAFPMVYYPLWEYKVAFSNDHTVTSERETKLLNDLGAEGWELVHVVRWQNGNAFYLKRMAGSTMQSVERNDAEGTCQGGER